MKRILCLLVLLSLPLAAAKQREWSTGKLLDFRMSDTGAGAARAQGEFCLAVQLGDIAYLLQYEPYSRWAYQPTDLVVGDQIQVQIDGKHMYINKPKGGGDFKTNIVRREKIVAGVSPSTCALPVQDKK